MSIPIPSDATNSSSDGNPPAGESAAQLLAAELADANPKSARVRRLLSVLLSLYVAVFLADACVSLVLDSLKFLFGMNPPLALYELTTIPLVLFAILIYGLMGLTPMIPKRLFLAPAVFCLVAMLGVAPFAMYGISRLRLISWLVSCCECALGLWILRRIQGGITLRWPLVPIERLGVRVFSWRNLAKFVAGNLFVLLPAVLAYLFLCAALAVNHFTDGFVALHPSGITVQSRKYVRDDGKTIQLFPMVHIADADFYQAISQSFPANSAVMMEGVTDEKHLLPNGINYAKAASSLGLTEQETEFAPPANEIVDADVDVDQFSATSIDVLNLIMNAQLGRADSGDVQKMFQRMSSDSFRKQVLDDLVTKRNEHLVQEIMSQLPLSNSIMVPWGAEHMSGISLAIQKSGFRLVGTRDFRVIRFRFFGRGE